MEDLRIQTNAEYKSPGFDALNSTDFEGPEGSFSFSPNPAYDQYLRMHKVLVGPQTVPVLESIHESLSGETLPRYLTAAGWAAVEAAMVKEDVSTKQRVALFDKGVASWERALEVQLGLVESERAYLIEPSAPYRTALNIAVAPLLKGIILSDVTDATCDQVFEDCLSIASANIEQCKIGAITGNHEKTADHIGFAYECNALLSLNRLKSKTWFAIPAFGRADSGHHHPEQSHDLSVIRQNWGTMKAIMPVEIKATAKMRARRRYKALLVRGKMHLSIPGKYGPDETFDAIAAVYLGTATREQKSAAAEVSGTFLSMLRDYHAGEVLGTIATKRSLTAFRNNARVVAKHPGLTTTAA